MASRWPAELSRLAAVWLICAVAISLPCADADAADAWLKLRRQGVQALLAASQRAAVPEPWQATWRLLDADAGELKGLRISVRQRMTTARKGKPAVLAAVIRFSGTRALAGVGVATVGQQVWLRGPGEKKAHLATGATLFAALPGLDLPLGLFAAVGLAGRYEGQLAGEFGGSAIVVMKPRYTEGEGWQRLKLGISKRYLVPTMAEINDGHGKPQGRWLWLDTRMDKDLMVADKLRLRTMARVAPFELALVGVERGKAIMALPVGEGALRWAHD